jgi:hypothetical protein
MSENNSQKLRETIQQIHVEWQQKGVCFPDPVQTRPLIKNTEKRLKVVSSCPMTAHLQEGVGAILHAGSLPKKGSERLSVSEKSRKILTDNHTFKKENT